ncbi:hypothetical protein K503DRAFT_92974 [Rhizopogon vinicolor AM-OR11-026]|uniref:Amino acid transporter transmembrane domain-containing protein n=1 Tax=Rhizopogon vinicolor AM-OR11-026 TaxID=1314800 RepID=A0A1B7N3D5_9AGAM|nr:hypothetical protein K503DRAFT_92974 [Rhizopogon vinicolor AM-OR11-026]
MPAIFSQLVGFTISLVQLGIAFSQGYSYYQTFPHDKWPHKSLVAILLIMTTASMVLSCTMYWSFISDCFRSDSPMCLSWAKMVSMMS